MLRSHPSLAEVIENLAALGYDQSDMFLAAYDWRLSYYNLQVCRFQIEP